MPHQGLPKAGLKQKQKQKNKKTKKQKNKKTKKQKNKKKIKPPLARNHKATYHSFDF
ncbi:hypothetical protein [Serratia marcescens]|uniref:hypothetical protein n=1 Tax=Serratia marcescens TaxID=615 RepID=UPI001F156411|nr:hypothetical protein [Serratia marcescens]